MKNFSHWREIFYVLSDFLGSTVSGSSKVANSSTTIHTVSTVSTTRGSTQRSNSTGSTILSTAGIGSTTHKSNITGTTTISSSSTTKKGSTGILTV